MALVLYACVYPRLEADDRASIDSGVGGTGGAGGGSAGSDSGIPVDAANNDLGRAVRWFAACAELGADGKSTPTQFFTEPFTVEMWLRIDAGTAPKQTLVYRGGVSTGSIGWSVLLDYQSRPGAYRLELWGGFGTRAWSRTVDVGLRYHVAVVRSVVPAEARFYIMAKGELTHTEDTVPFNVSWPEVADLQIAGRGGLCDTALAIATIDELRIWSTARTRAEIDASIGPLATCSDPALAAYYRFDDVPGSDFADCTNRTGTLIRPLLAAGYESLSSPFDDP
jgi:hypothetical protein